MLALPAPMKAVAGPLPADDHEWAYEVKWDGMRVVAGVDGGPSGDGALHAVSSNGLDVTLRFPELGGLAAHLAGHTVILDGEVVAYQGDRTDFSLLQQRMHIASAHEARRRAAEVPVWYVVFDLLHLDGIDTMPLPYTDRRRLLLDLVEPGDGWQVPAHRVGDGQALLDAARARGLEGIMAKRPGSRYEPGRRSHAWRKVKVRRRQELVVGGWTEGSGNRSGVPGALLVGYHDDTGLRFGGGVGTGFSGAELDRWAALLADLATDTSPFTDRLPPTVKGAHFVTPRPVVEVEFAEWTPEGRLRHPAYLGQRFDTDPATIRREPDSWV